MPRRVSGNYPAGELDRGGLFSSMRPTRAVACGVFGSRSAARATLSPLLWLFATGVSRVHVI